jgi:protein TonB
MNVFLIDPTGGQVGKTREPFSMRPCEDPSPAASGRSFLGKDGAGEESPPRLWVLLALLSLGLHVLGSQWLSRPEERCTEARPLQAMEVALMAATVPEPAAAPQPAPAPPPPPKSESRPKPKPKPAPPRPVKKIVKPAPPKPVETVRREVAPAETRTPEPPTSESSAAENNTPVPSPAAERPARSEPQGGREAPVTPASFNAGYLHNPRPAYPASARQQGWEGTVRLRVRVTEDGRARQVDIHQSSGYDLLDDAALDAVRQWRFTPAQRGDTPVASWVIVPIAFHLNR